MQYMYNVQQNPLVYPDGKSMVRCFFQYQISPFFFLPFSERKFMVLQKLREFEFKLCMYIVH